MTSSAKYLAVHNILMIWGQWVRNSTGTGYARAYYNNVSINVGNERDLMILDKLVGRLPRNPRHLYNVIWWRYVTPDKSDAEIAKKLGITVRTYYNWLVDARGLINDSWRHEANIIDLEKYGV